MVARDRTTALVERLARAVGPASTCGGDGTATADSSDRVDPTDLPRLVEVGIGERTAIAAGLADRGFPVVATDVVDRSVPESVHFVRDDVTDPDPSIYRDAGLVYALRLPPELHRAFASVAVDAGASAAFTTLGGDSAAVRVRPEQLSGGETLFRVVEADDWEQ